MAMSAMEDYYSQVINAKAVLVNQKLVELAIRIIYDLHNPGKYRFDEEAAVAKTEFVEKFLSQGKKKDIVLLPEDKARLQAVFGFTDKFGNLKYKDELMCAMEDYFIQIADGSIVACHRMIQASRRILIGLYNPGEYHFDLDKAMQHITFIETFCKLPAGKRNTPLKLELFQKARLQAIFGFVDKEGYRQYQEVLIVEGRKNGKTTETAAVELDLLINDDEWSPQIYNVATAKDQAKLGFKAIQNMLAQSPDLAKHVKKTTEGLEFKYNKGIIKALSSDTNKLDGLDIHGATIDELAAIKDRDLYDLIKQAVTARRQPLIFTITTNGFVRNGIFDAQYEYSLKILDGTAENDNFLPFIYELDEISEWDKEECWIKANPGLGTIKDIKKLRQNVQKAKDDITFKPTVLTKDFNMKQTGTTSWLKWEELYNAEKVPKYKYKYCIGGIDAADTTDLSAACILLMKPDDPHIYVKHMYWITEEKLRENEEAGKRNTEDNVPYRIWEAQGYLRIVDTNTVSKKVFLEWFKELEKEERLYFKWVGYDQWHMYDAEIEAYEDAFGRGTMNKVSQQIKNLSQPMKELKADLKAGLIVYDDNPITRWCLANTAVKTDVNANIQPVKTEDPRRRIDGTMALLDAYVVLKNNWDEYISQI